MPANTFVAFFFVVILKGSVVDDNFMGMDQSGGGLSYQDYTTRRGRQSCEVVRIKRGQHHRLMAARSGGVGWTDHCRRGPYTKCIAFYNFVPVRVVDLMSLTIQNRAGTTTMRRLPPFAGKHFLSRVAARQVETFAVAHQWQGRMDVLRLALENKNGVGAVAGALERMFL
jgi:hypothetical protein